MQKNTSGSRPAGQWDESSFFTELQVRKGTEIAKTAKNIIERGRNNNFIIDWGKWESDGGFQIKYNYEGKEISLISVKISAKIKIWFYFLHHQTFTFKEDENNIELLNMLNGIKGITIPREKLRLEPTIPIAVLINGLSLKTFLNIRMDFATVEEQWD